jgi:hypothetical protein
LVVGAAMPAASEVGATSLVSSAEGDPHARAKPLSTAHADLAAKLPALATMLLKIAARVERASS